MSSENQTAKCTYIAHANGIHEFIMADGSNETLDQWLQHMDQIIAQYPQGQFLRTMYVSQLDSLPSISALMARVRLLAAHHPMQPDARHAVLYRNLKK